MGRGACLVAHLFTCLNLSALRFRLLKESDIVGFCLLTGIRRSDGLKVTAENFDFDRMIAAFAQHELGMLK